MDNFELRLKMIILLYLRQITDGQGTFTELKITTNGGFFYKFISRYRFWGWIKVPIYVENFKLSDDVNDKTNYLSYDHR